MILKKYKYILSLVFIALISHLQWFNLNSILNYSDWSYWPNEATKQLYSSWGIWINYFNFGSVNIQLPFNFFKSIWSLFTNLGFSYDLATKITFLIPIAISGFIAPYILFKKLTKNELISFAVALFYGTTTYFLIRQTAHMPIAFIYALTPLTFYLFIRACEKNKLVNWLTFILIYWVSICYEIRIIYIVSFLLFFYFVFFISDIKKYWKNILLSILFLLGLNLFWLIPTILGGFSEQISAVAKRGLFGNFLFDLGHAFALYDSSWTGGLPNSQFIKQPIIWYFWFIPVMAFSSFLFNKNNKYKKEIIFFGVISLIGIFLTKQADSPLTNAYSWLYENFPGFYLFREASKFYLLTAIGYTGLLGYSLLILKEHKNEILNKYTFTTFIIIIIYIAIWNAKPLITSEMGTMFVPRHIPSDYIVLKDFILKQPEYFRTMWVPTDSRWGIYVNEKPRVSDVGMIQSDWKNFVDHKKHDNSWLAQEQIMDVLKKDFSNQLFDISSVKYVIVPIRDIENDDDFFIYYGDQNNPNIRGWYISQLDNVKWLKKIDIGTKELVVYENENFRSHIYTTQKKETIYYNIDFNKVENKQISLTQYKINLANIKGPVYLNFSEAYHSKWKLYPGQFNWTMGFRDSSSLPESDHSQNNAKLDSFKIDPEYLKKNFPKECSINPDGSINIELTLFFQPQSYFYIGLIISGATLLGCLGYLAYDWRKRRKNGKTI